MLKKKTNHHNQYHPQEILLLCPYQIEPPQLSFDLDMLSLKITIDYKLLPLYLTV